MAVFQVVALKPYAGVSKAGNPYSMLIAKGIFTNDEGVIDTAELVFMEGKDRKLPTLVVGQKYEPEVSMYVNRDGKLSAGIEGLKLLKAETVKVAA